LFCPYFQNNKKSSIMDGFKATRQMANNPHAEAVERSKVKKIDERRWALVASPNWGLQQNSVRQICPLTYFGF
jgi:hypothetical protein